MTASMLQKDPLTGFYSRAAFDGIKLSLIGRARQAGTALSFLIIDLDHFKSVNDAFGHSRGDRVLEELGRRIGSSLRSKDMAFRMGGDEFLVALPGIPNDEAVQVANRILRLVSASPFGEEPGISLSVSIGVATFPEDGSGPSELIEAADRRQYLAKRQGRNRSVHHDREQGMALELAPPDRMLERDPQLWRAQSFLEQLGQVSRGLFFVEGDAGAGQTRFLMEMRSQAETLGFATLSLCGSQALKGRVMGVLTQVQRVFPLLPGPHQGMERFAAALKSAVAEKSGLLVTLDDVHLMDSSSLQAVEALYLTSYLPRLGLVYAARRTEAATVLTRRDSLLGEVRLDPISPIGVRTFLRQSLHREPPAELLEPLLKKSGGMPGPLWRALQWLRTEGALEAIETEAFQLTPASLDGLTDHLDRRSGFPQNNLPGGLADFVGRETELNQLEQLVRENRLVAIVGPGGCGKTRLVTQLGAENLLHFPGGVFLQSMVGLTHADLLASALLETMGQSSTGVRSPTSSLYAQLKRSRALIILDNYEPVSGVESLVDGLLEASPGLHVVITSRHRLSNGNTLYLELGGLPVPPARSDVAIEGFDSVQLFLRRARSSFPGFSPTPQELDMVAQICRLLEGLPLAIELVAGWIRTTSCTQIADRIRTYLPAETTERSSQARRRASVRAVLAAFWNRLSPSERRCLRRLSVLRGSFSAEAARQVAGASPFFLGSLVSIGYLRSTANGRFEMHELLRQFALRRLNARPEERRKTEARAANFFAEATQLSAETLKIGGEATRSARLDFENIRATWDWAVQSSSATVIARMLEGLLSFIHETDQLQLGIDMVGAAVGRMRMLLALNPQERSHRELLSKLLLGMTRLRFFTTRHQDLQPLVEEARLLARSIGYTLGEANCEQIMGSFSMFEYRLENAYIHATNALKMSVSLSDKQLEADARSLLGMVHIRSDEPQLAAEQLRLAVGCFRELGLRPREALTLCTMAECAMHLGDVHLSIEHAREACRISGEGQNVLHRIITTYTLGYVATRLADFQFSRQQFTEAIRLSRLAGESRLMVANGYELARALTYLRQSREASNVAERAVAQARSIHDPVLEARSLLILSRVWLLLGNSAGALSALEEALELAEARKEESLILDTHATLARAHSALEDHEKAQTHLERSLELLQRVSLHSLDLPFEVLGNIWECMSRADDPRRSGVCVRARVLADTYLESFRDGRERHLVGERFRQAWPLLQVDLELEAPIALLEDPHPLFSSAHFVLPRPAN